ncbi:MAG: hypothetical protein JXA77_10880 [Bacteroidales bacterium]|nr:hypothetical protein [Bacteroidales bacterium]MBN2818996.1 hypothetical protein [Bacteroidales bacterium]
MKKATILLFFLLLHISLFSIENKFKYILPEDGLSEGNIACIFQDSKGFLWFGTFNGLNRFDGYDFKTFYNNPNDSTSLAHNHVKYVCEDALKRLWFGTFGNGLSIYYPEIGKFKNISFVVVDGDSVKLTNTAGIVNGPDNTIWTLDETAGLFVFDSDLNLIKAYTPKNGAKSGFPNMSYFALSSDKDKNIWVGAGNGTLLEYDRKMESFSKFIFDSRKTANDDAIKTMYIDSKGIVWIGTTSQGAYSFDPKTNTFENYRQGQGEITITGNTVMAFAEDWLGNLLIGIDGGGLNVFNSIHGTMEHIAYDIKNTQSLNTNAIYSLFLDRSETLWIGTYSGGLNYQGRFNDKFTTYKPDPFDPNSLSYKNVTSILEDSDGDIWIGTDGGGINLMNKSDGSFEHFKADLSNPNWLHTNVIIHMMQDIEGDIYVGSYNGGLTIFNKEDRIFKQYLPDVNDSTSIAGMHPWFIFQDSYGEIWVGLLAVGLDKFDKKTETFTHYISNIEDSTTLYGPNIKVIYEDKNRVMWVGTEGGGLHSFNRKADNFTRFLAGQGDGISSISNNDIRDIFEDSKNRFWVGTADGLNLMDRNSRKFEVIKKSDGLAGNIINNILEDDNGILWISTNNGISKFNPDERTFRNYDKTDGLQGNEFNYTAAIESSDGLFYFGGKEGFSVFDPATIADNPFKPEIVITDFTILNKNQEFVKTRIKGNEQMVSVPYAKNIVLTYKDKSIGIRFAALDYSNPLKNAYEYMLEGFDEEWNTVSAIIRSVSYSNLKGGTYTFRVRGSNSDDVWNEEGASVDLIVKPPFWKRTWFIILISALILFIAYRYISQRQDKVKREKEMLESRINEGLKEVEIQKNQVQKANTELEEKIENERQQAWFNQGMNQISDVISHNKQNLNKLAQEVIINLVAHLEVEQGAMYLVNEDSENEACLEVMGCFAPDESRIIGNRIETEVGNVGAAFSTNKTIKLDNLPKDYSYFSSGLGEDYLRHAVLIPISLDESVIGVFELLSFRAIDDFKISFVKKAGETLTSILTALNATSKAQKLLDEQKLLAEESEAQEEELRQNLEELQATQEEASRNSEEMIRIAKQSEEKEKQYLEKIKKLEAEIKKLKK